MSPTDRPVPKDTYEATDAGRTGSAAPSSQPVPKDISTAPPASDPAAKRASAGSRPRLRAEPAARDSVAAALRDGRRLTREKRYAEAIARLEPATRRFPSHARALAALGYARLLAGELEAAERDLDEARDLAQDPALVATIEFNLGLVMERRHEPLLARNHFAMAHWMRPGKATASKLGGVAACPVSVVPRQAESVADWAALWRRFTSEDEEPVADEAAAREDLDERSAIGLDVDEVPGWTTLLLPGSVLAYYSHVLMVQSTGGALLVHDLEELQIETMGCHDQLLGIEPLVREPLLVRLDIEEAVWSDSCEDDDEDAYSDCALECDWPDADHAKLYAFAPGSRTGLSLRVPVRPRQGDEQQLLLLFTVEPDAAGVRIHGPGCDERIAWPKDQVP